MLKQWSLDPDKWQLCSDIRGAYTVCSDWGWGKRGLGIRLAYHNIHKWMNSDTKDPGVIFSHTLFKHTILFEVKDKSQVYLT